MLLTQSSVPAQVCPRKVCTPRREHIWDGSSLPAKAAQKSTKQHCWCHFTPRAFTKAGGRAGRELEVKGQLSSMHHTASLQILPAQPEKLLQRGRAQTDPSLRLKMEKSLLLWNCVSSHLYFCHWMTGWEERRKGWVGRHQREENYHQIRKLKWEGREKEKTEAKFWSCPLQRDLRLLYTCLSQNHKALT